jgi:hypothetical protein
LVIDGLLILDVPMGSHDFTSHFLDEVLFQNMTDINDFPFMRDAQVALGILSSCVVH